MFDMAHWLLGCLKLCQRGVYKLGDRPQLETKRNCERKMRRVAQQWLSDTFAEDVVRPLEN